MSEISASKRPAKDPYKRRKGLSRLGFGPIEACLWMPWIAPIMRQFVARSSHIWSDRPEAQGCNMK